jgi:hypothetical protein
MKAVAMARYRRRKVEGTPPHTSPETMVYGRSENAPDPATLCHFFAPFRRLSGDAVVSASRVHIMGSGLRYGRPGGPRTEWHRCSGDCHRAGGLLFTRGMGSPAPAGRAVTPRACSRDHAVVNSHWSSVLESVKLLASETAAKSIAPTPGSEPRPDGMRIRLHPGRRSVLVADFIPVKTSRLIIRRYWENRTCLVDRSSLGSW